jgi:hypothetical protein
MGGHDMGKRDGSSWSHILQYSFLKVFADDEMIDEGEWAMLKKLALADGVVDTQERMVLAKIFDRVDPNSLEPKVREEIEAFRAEHGI